MQEASDSQVNTKEHPDLYRKTIRGGVWLIAERAALQAFAFVRLFVLAWLLPPREFGILAIVMLLLQILETFTQTGFSTALVQRKEEDVHPYLSTVWTVNVIRGIVLFFIFIVAAPVAIRFFDGDGIFRPVDFSKPAALAEQLQNPGDPLSVYLMSRLPEDVRRQVEEAADPSRPPSEAQKRLSDAFNTLVQQEAIYRPEPFSQVQLSPYALACVASVSPETQRRTHRLLLEQVWPDQIQRTILDRPQLIQIIQVIGFVLLLRAFGNTAVVYFTKTMRFEKNFVMHLTATTVNVMATVILAIVLRSVWALVWGMLLAELTSLLLSYAMHPWRPRFAVDRTRLRQMWRFGRWITGLSMLEFLLTTGDSILVGRLLGATSLGLYQMSTRLSSLPVTELTSVIGMASFPAFCRIQLDIVRLREAFLKTIDLTSVLVIPMMGCLLLFSDDLVRLFMQKSWLPMASTLRIMAIFGLFRTVSLGSLFHALGKPHYLTAFMTVRIALLAIIFYPLTQAYGLDGMAWAVGLSGMALLVPGYLCLMRLLQCGLGEIVAHQAAPAGGVLAMMAAVGSVKLWLWTETTFLRFFTLAAAGLILYLAVCLLLTPIFKAQWLSFMIERWHQMKQIAEAKLKPTFPADE